jgi:hypothetical protein
MHEPIRRHMLAQTSLTYSKSLEIARGRESAEKETKAFKTTEPAIKKVGTNPQRSSTTQNSYRCGRSNHHADTCKFKDAQCHACGKTGHIAPCSLPFQNVQTQEGIDTQESKPQFDEVESSNGEVKINSLGKQSQIPL